MEIVYRNAPKEMRPFSSKEDSFIAFTMIIDYYGGVFTTQSDYGKLIQSKSMDEICRFAL